MNREIEGGHRIVQRDRALVTAGRTSFGLAMLGFAAEHWVALDFVTRVLPPWPVPASIASGRALCAVLVGAVLAASGIAVLARRRMGAAGLALAALFASGLLLQAPRVVARWRVGAVWTNPLKVLVLVGGALLIATIAAGVRPGGTTTRRRGWTFSRFALALFLTVGGVQHFVYATFVETLVPRWIPGTLFWTYAAGVALIVAGLGLAIARTARLAAFGAGAMIFTWFLILHIPRAVTAWTNPGEWSGVFESLAIAGIAWLIAGASRDFNSSEEHHEEARDV